jgi:hypothetical protein
LTSPPKETYQINPLAEDNSDYINLECSEVKAKNSELEEEIRTQKARIESLKAKLGKRKEAN